MARDARATMNSCATSIRATIDIQNAVRKLPEQLEDMVYDHEIQRIHADMVQRRAELERSIQEAKEVLKFLQDTEAL